MLIPINDSTEVQINTDYINQDILKQKLETVELAYIEGISWLAGVPKIIANNNPETDSENIDNLLKQKANVEKNMADIVEKLLFLRSLLV